MTNARDRRPASSAFDPAHLETLLAEHIKDRRAITALRLLLSRMAQTAPNYAERSAWLQDLGDWLHGANRPFT